MANMLYLGRVITKSKTLELLDFVDRTEENNIDKNIPTLIVGKKLAQSLYGEDKIKFLNKEIEPNVYWTFAKNERRDELESDLKKFNDRIIENLKKNITYEFFSILTEPFERIKGFIKFMRGKYKKIIYLTNNHMYIYCHNKVFGFSLNDTECLGISSSKIISILHKNPYNVIINNNDFVSKTLKKYLKDNKIIIPYLYFLQNQ